MKFKLLLKRRVYWFLTFGILILLLLLVLINRYLIFQKSLSLIDKVDIVWMGHTNQKVVALTFDDGPDPVYTPRILEILRKYQAPATFFVEGASARQYPALIKAESQNGHSLGNHTYSHPRLSRLSMTAIQTELTATDREIKKITGKKPGFFRPPYEELSENILVVSRAQHKQIVLSTVTLEHESVKTSRAKAERVLGQIFPGAIILAHDGRLNRSTTVTALPYLITGLKARGYRIIPLKKLLHQSH